MTTTNHTPGPWTCEDLFGDAHHASVCSDNWMGLASVVVRFDGKREDDATGLANARLIAAAPDLLAALEDLDFCIGNGCGDTAWDEACARMQVAIAKAKGV